MGFRSCDTQVPRGDRVRVAKSETRMDLLFMTPTTTTVSSCSIIVGQSLTYRDDLITSMTQIRHRGSHRDYFVCTTRWFLVGLLLVGRNVRAMTTTTTSKVHRILAYGDSLTAGTSDDAILHPYAPVLQQGLIEKGWNTVQVRHVGLPGWTTQAMVDDLDGPATGLRSVLQRVQDPSLSLVIVLAGTNDLGFGYTADQIVSNLQKLHTVALQEHDIPRTLAVGIPSSLYQERTESAKALCQSINERLQALSISVKGLHYINFPFGYGGDFWASDGLHFSPKGYQSLGESLVPVVEQILKDLDATDCETR